MVIGIGPHDRADLRGCSVAECEGRRRRRRGHRGGEFHALASLHTQEADGGDSQTDERYLAERGRDYEGYREVGDKAHSGAVYNIWCDQRDIHHDMDHPADCIGLREVHLFLRRLQFASRFQRRAVLQPRSGTLDHYHDNWQRLSVSQEIQRGCIHDAFGVDVNGAIPVHGGEAGDTVSGFTELPRRISSGISSLGKSTDGERIKKIMSSSEYCVKVSYNKAITAVGIE